MSNFQFRFDSSSSCSMMHVSESPLLHLTRIVDILEVKERSRSAEEKKTIGLCDVGLFREKGSRKDRRACENESDRKRRHVRKGDA